MTKFKGLLSSGEWTQVLQLSAKRFRCGFCGEKVSSAKGYMQQGSPAGLLYICTDCHRPSYFEGAEQSPGEALGDKVAHVPSMINELYEEARQAASAGSHTAAVLACRKLLMHIAVEKGAEENKAFAYYVSYLENEGFTPPNSKEWVDLIRSKGNEANHEIVLMKKDDAEEILIFSGMLLKFIYEFPNRIKKAVGSS